MNTPLGTIADTADLSFYGGMNYTFDRFAEEYPDATVILITPIRRHGVLWQNSQGLHIMALGWEAKVPEVLKLAGI